MVSSPVTGHQTEALPPSPETAEEQLPPEDAIVNLPATQAATENGHSSDGTAEEPQQSAVAVTKWPGWPGSNVFRLIVPVLKVGSIIGRKGEFVKKICEETRARIRVLEGALGNTDRIVLISGKEDPDAQLSPAMVAVLRVFKCVAGLSSSDESSGSLPAGAPFCSIRLLVASSQAIYLIGKQGSTIKSIQESSGASVRVLPEDELPSYASSDERIVEIHGDAVKVLKALEAVLGQLRKFLVDHSVVPIFEKTYNATISQDRAEAWSGKSESMHIAAPTLPSAPQAGISSEFALSVKRDSYLHDREAPANSKYPYSMLSHYGRDHGFSSLHSTVGERAIAPMVTQMTKIMQVPLIYAEDIIGIGGSHVAYIRRTSGAILTIQESRGLPDEITIEIKGTSSQVQTAEQLIEEFINNHKEPARGVYGKTDPGVSSFSKLADATYSSSSFQSQSLREYGSSTIGGYGSFRY